MKQSWGARGALAAIGFYRRWVSPLTPPSCRFVPTCSHYTYDAIARFGLWRGGLLGAKRVCRCHPWNPGGYDPVPEATSLEVSRTGEAEQNRKELEREGETHFSVSEASAGPLTRSFENK